MRELLIVIAFSLGLLVLGIFLGLFIRGIDRKFAAYFQSRVGPPLLQPFYDLEKLMIKQTIIPENSVSWIFRGAPVLALASTSVLLIYVVLPYLYYLHGSSGPFLTAGDLIVILYLLMIPAISLIAGGFASGSPYATVGAQREVVILMSVEVPLAIVVIAVAWKMSQAAGGAHPFSLLTVASNPIWTGMGPMGILGGGLLVLTLMAVVPAETGKVPFDQAEAETEIAEGLLAEYSGKYLALYGLADAVKSLAFTALFVVLFFPHGFTDLTGFRIVIAGGDYTFALDILLFIVKVIIVYTVAITAVRVAMARLKISQAAKLFLITLSMLSIAGYLLIYLDPRISGL